MAYLTKDQSDISKQTIRNVHIKVNLLNFSLQTIDSLEGNVTEGNITVDSTADLRRSCTITLVVTDSSFDPSYGSKIWLDRYIQIMVGVDKVNGDTVWNNMGIFLINAPTYSYDSDTNTLSFDGVDMMAKLSGARNGYLTGDATFVVQQGANVREQIQGLLATAGFKQYVVSDCLNTDGSIQDVPYDMEFTQGSTYLDVLDKLRDILPNYQFYFDVYGVFHYEHIPYSVNDPVIVGNDIWGDNVTNEEVTVDFESVKNSIEVYGATHDTTYYGDSSVTTVTDNAIVTTISALTSLSNGAIVCFTLPSDATGNLTLNASGFGVMSIVDENGKPITSLAKDTIWCVQARIGGATDTWLFLGHLQAQATAKDTNADSPFYIGNAAGEIKIVLYDSDYENIQSDYLAQERADYELYQRCRLNDTITLTCVPIYGLDVNWKVEYLPAHQVSATEPFQYITQSITVDLSESGNMTVVMSRFYPDYTLPTGYKKVSCIKSTGTQWIDTNYTPNGNTIFSIAFDTNSVDNNNGFIFGAGTGYAGGNTFEFYPWSNSWEVNYGVEVDFAGTATKNALVTVELYSNKLYINNTEVHTFTAQTFTSTSTLGLFALNRPAGAYISPNTIKLYNCTIKEGSTTLHDYVPCIRLSDNAVGLYDTIAGAFLGNSGTGTFEYEN